MLSLQRNNTADTISVLRYIIMYVCHIQTGSPSLANVDATVTQLDRISILNGSFEQPSTSYRCMSLYPDDWGLGSRACSRFEYQGLGGSSRWASHLTCM